MNVTLSNGKILPIEMHKIKIVQQTSLPPADRRLEAIGVAGYNTFLLRTKDIFLDMLTDSGTNAMSDNQLAAMMVADDAYAGSESFYKLADAVQEVLGFRHIMPVHQGRAAEHLLAKVFVKPGDVVLMNYHFTTSKAHVDLAGGRVLEIFRDDALQPVSDNPFKGNMDLKKFEAAVKQFGVEHISYVRMEATTNLIGGQPFSIQNLREVSAMARKIQYSAGIGWQPDLRKCLFHPAAGTRICQRHHSGDHSGNDGHGGYSLHVRAQECRGAWWPDRHQ